MGDGKPCCSSCGAGKACESDLRAWEVVYGKKPTASIQELCAEALADAPVSGIVTHLIHFIDFVVSRRRFGMAFAALSQAVLSGAIFAAITDEEIVKALGVHLSNVGRVRSPKKSSEPKLKGYYVLASSARDTGRKIRRDIVEPWVGRMRDAQSNLAARGKDKVDRKFFNILLQGDWDVWELEVLLDNLLWEYQGKRPSINVARTEDYNEGAGLAVKEERVALIHGNLIHRDHELYVAYLGLRRFTEGELREGCPRINDAACRASWNQGFLARLDDHLDAARKSALDGWFLGPIDDSDPEVRAAKAQADAKRGADAKRQLDLKARGEAERARQSEAEKQRATEAFKSQRDVALKFVEKRAKDRAEEKRKEMMSKASGLFAKTRIWATGKPPKHTEPAQPATSTPTSQPPVNAQPAPSAPSGFCSMCPFRGEGQVHCAMCPFKPKDQAAPSAPKGLPAPMQPHPLALVRPVPQDRMPDQSYTEPAPSQTQPTQQDNMSATELVLALADSGEADDVVELSMVVLEAWVLIEDLYSAGDEEGAQEAVGFLSDIEGEFIDLVALIGARDIVDFAIKILGAAERLGLLDNAALTDGV